MFKCPGEQPWCWEDRLKEGPIDSRPRVGCAQVLMPNSTFVKNRPITTEYAELAM